MLTVDIELREKDYISLTTYTQLDSSQVKALKRKRSLRQIILYAIILGILIWSDSLIGNYTTTIIYAVIFFLFTFAIPYFQRPFIGRRLSAIYNAPENESMLQRKEYIFSDTGINISSQFTNTKLQWPAIIKKVETPDYFFLYQTSIHAMIIPKRFFNDWQLTDLEKLLSTHLSFHADMGDEIEEG